MRTKISGTFTRFFVMILTAVALFLPVSLGLAQDPMQPSRKGQQPELPFRSPSNVMNMRAMTNAHRKAAAQRNADRRAKAHKQVAPPASQAGGNQAGVKK